MGPPRFQVGLHRRQIPGELFPPPVPQAQQLVQVEAAKVQEELANTVVEGFSSDETVRIQG